MRICVYCASSDHADAMYREAAYRFGELVAKAGHTIVYGGGATGSMGALANGAMAHGGHVIGITPRFMADLEWSHKGISELIQVDDMRERKRRLRADSDAIVALPGGCGTMDELFETITLKKLARYLKPIVLLNTRNFYAPLITFLQHMIDERFMDPRHSAMWQCVEQPEDILDAIAAAPDWSEEARTFAVYRNAHNANRLRE